MKKLVIGLTGGIGAGKSTVADIFSSFGVKVIDADRIAHELCAPGQEGVLAIAKSFGPDFLSQDGSLDRTKMRELIFSNTSARGALEQILHPLIRNRAISTLTEGDSDTPYFLLVVPLLFESAAFRNLVDRTLVIDIPEDVQVARVQARSGLDPATIHAIMCTQLPRSARNALADDRLSNTLPQEELRKAVKQLHQRYLALRAN